MQVDINIPSKVDFSLLIREKFPVLHLENYTNREKIEIMEWVMDKLFDNVADELPVRSWIHGGMYTRELTIPADTLLTGKIHTESHMCMLTKGRLSVMTDDGIKIINAPFTFVARAGIKKIGYAHTDCVFTTVHATDKINLKEIEDELLVDSDLSWVDNLYKEQVALCQAQQ